MLQRGHHVSFFFLWVLALLPSLLELFFFHFRSASFILSSLFLTTSLSASLCFCLSTSLNIWCHTSRLLNYASSLGQSQSIIPFHLPPYADGRQSSCQTSPRTNQNTDNRKLSVTARLSNEIIVSNEITGSEKQVPVFRQGTSLLYSIMQLPVFRRGTSLPCSMTHLEQNEL